MRLLKPLFLLVLRLLLLSPKPAQAAIRSTFSSSASAVFSRPSVRLWEDLDKSLRLPGGSETRGSSFASLASTSLLGTSLSHRPPSASSTVFPLSSSSPSSASFLSSVSFALRFHRLGSDGLSETKSSCKNSCAYSVFASASRDSFFSPSARSLVSHLPAFSESLGFASSPCFVSPSFRISSPRPWGAGTASCSQWKSFSTAGDHQVSPSRSFSFSECSSSPLILQGGDAFSPASSVFSPCRSASPFSSPFFSPVFASLFSLCRLSSRSQSLSQFSTSFCMSESPLRFSASSCPDLLPPNLRFPACDGETFQAEDADQAVRTSSVSGDEAGRPRRDGPLCVFSTANGDSFFSFRDAANADEGPRRGSAERTRLASPFSRGEASCAAQRGVCSLHMKVKVPTPALKPRTRKSIAKRFKITATGKLLYRHSGRQHLMSSKSGRRKRRLRKVCVLTGVMAKKYLACIHTPRARIKRRKRRPQPVYKM
ncbi:ribosomal protein RPL35 [Toxoplasma gondii VAND]|uniref:50S ribosomal protein L35 n=1 Tax=Toxoplasma gondii VAND TaxID=933077 RepID=A0A086Q6Q4_TOXGO|nr:ribosomal protein RPL35 [Toxoplasma gondii VAND]